jgi:hypothetical protein
MWLAAARAVADEASSTENALARAGRYLVSRQSADGAWRSETYGALRDGPSLTPLVMSGLFFLPQAGPEAEAAFRRGTAYLASFVDKQGRIRVGPRELEYPVYTAALASRVVVLQERIAHNLRRQRAWLEYLRGRQLCAPLGWQPSDSEYGGWGFSLDVPRKPAPGQLREYFFESNLSATVFGLAALASARTPHHDPAYAAALLFVKRCQNFADDAALGDPRYDDGGFFFIPGDAVQNKAGLAGTDRYGRPRFHSYGTMTADGLRALLRCGLSTDHPRVIGARRWLEQHFSATCNPGRFNADREILRNATYYYWTWAVAHAFLVMDVREIETPGGQVGWTEVLTKELLRRQRPDGSWANSFTDAKEDDPLIATPWAAAGLAICRALGVGRPATLATACRTAN